MLLLSSRPSRLDLPLHAEGRGRCVSSDCPCHSLILSQHSAYRTCQGLRSQRHTSDKWASERRSLGLSVDVGNPDRREPGEGLLTIEIRISVLPVSVFSTTNRSTAQTVGYLALAESSQHLSRHPLARPALWHTRTNNEQPSRLAATSFGSQSARHDFARAGISAKRSAFCCVVNIQPAIPYPDPSERDPAV